MNKNLNLQDVEYFWKQNEHMRREKLLGPQADSCIFNYEGKCECDGSVCKMPGDHNCEGFEPLFTLR